MSGRGLNICVISGSSRTVAHAYGLHQDARILEQILREAKVGGTIRIDSVEHIDAYTYGTGNRSAGAFDINIHLEVPCRMAWRYARINIVVVKIDRSFRTGNMNDLISRSHAPRRNLKRIIPYRDVFAVGNLDNISIARNIRIGYQCAIRYVDIF